MFCPAVGVFGLTLLLLGFVPDRVLGVFCRHHGHHPELLFPEPHWKSSSREPAKGMVDFFSVSFHTLVLVLVHRGQSWSMCPCRSITLASWSPCAWRCSVNTPGSNIKVSTGGPTTNVGQMERQVAIVGGWCGNPRLSALVCSWSVLGH